MREKEILFLKLFLQLTEEEKDDALAYAEMLIAEDEQDDLK